MTEEPNPDWQRLGTSSYFRLEPPDVFYGRTAGVLTETDFKAVLEEMKRLTAGGQRLFWLADLAQMTTVTPGVRRLAATDLPILPIAGLAAFGASFQHRVIMTLVMKTIEVLRLSSRMFPIVMVEIEPEARAWIQKRRDELEGRAAH